MYQYNHPQPPTHHISQMLICTCSEANRPADIQSAELTPSTTSPRGMHCNWYPDSLLTLASLFRFDCSFVHLYPSDLHIPSSVSWNSPLRGKWKSTRKSSSSTCGYTLQLFPTIQQEFRWEETSERHQAKGLMRPSGRKRRKGKRYRKSYQKTYSFKMSVLGAVLGDGAVAAATCLRYRPSHFPRDSCPSPC